MSPHPEITSGLLEAVRAKAAACAEEAHRALAAGAEWQRQAREWTEYADALEDHGGLAPLVPVAPRHRF